MVTRADVERAAEAIRGRVRRTPVLDASEIAPGLRLKAELFQFAGSFKARGVTNRLDALTREERERGVIGVSAGNHAAALAWGAARAGVDALVVMNANASPYKVAKARSYGATIDLEARDMGEVFARLDLLLRESGRTLIHPFDDPVVIAGQGTVGLEILEDAADVDVVVVPVGGGGLISGIAAAVGAAGVRVVGVEPERSAALTEALRAGHAVPVTPDTIAGGLDAPFAGDNALATCVANGVETVLVGDDEIAAATRVLYADAKLAVEPAGAAGLAALLQGRIEATHPVVVVSGGNVAPETASGILAVR